MNIIKAEINYKEYSASKKFKKIYWIIEAIVVVIALVDYGLDELFYEGFLTDGETILNVLLVAGIALLPIVIPPLINIIQKYICDRISLSLTSDKIEGSYLKRFAKSSFTFPIEQIDNIVILDSFLDKFRSGKTLALSSNSIRIKFSYVQNADEVSVATLKAIKDYKENYGNSRNKPSIEKTKEINEVDKLKGYKELLDTGIITQEEFETKKKELLNL